jgi:hypothetical protein
MKPDWPVWPHAPALARTLKSLCRVFGYTMSKTIRVDEWFHSWVKTEKEPDETMSEALVRLTGAPGPDPDDVAGIISPAAGERMKDRLADLDRSSRDDIQERVASDS